MKGNGEKTFSKHVQDVSEKHESFTELFQIKNLLDA
jgi:hypothetical protein